MFSKEPIQRVRPGTKSSFSRGYRSGKLRKSFERVKNLLLLRQLRHHWANCPWCFTQSNPKCHRRTTTQRFLVITDRQHSRVPFAIDIGLLRHDLRPLAKIGPQPMDVSQNACGPPLHGPCTINWSQLHFSSILCTRQDIKRKFDIRIQFQLSISSLKHVIFGSAMALIGSAMEVLRAVFFNLGSAEPSGSAKIFLGSANY
jgi:hypothetical protein